MAYSDAQFAPSGRQESLSEAVPASSGRPNASAMTVVGAWVISILVHAVGLAVMLFVVFPFSSSEKPAPAAVRVRMIDPLRFSMSDTPAALTPKTKADPLPPHLNPKTFTPLSQLTAPHKLKLPILSIGSAGRDFSRYGLGSAGASPQFFGLGGSARGVRKVVYVVDRSGSMLDTFDYVRAVLKRSVSALRRSQKFHVIFFNSGLPLENPPRKLVSAIAAQKKAFFSFLENVLPEGSTHPGPAMHRALRMKPDIVYFLTDGEFDPELVVKLRDWNRDHKVKVFTIAYFDSGGASLLEQIAREHGGEFKFVTENDLP